MGQEYTEELYKKDLHGQDKHDVVQETGIKSIPKKKKFKKVKWLSEKVLQITVKRREAKGKEKRKDISISMQSSKE